MGKHNNKTTGFDALAKKAGKEYGSKAAGERVAGAQFQKMKKAGHLEEEGMSRAAKGYEKYGKQGMQALAKAGREGKALDPVRNKYDKYDNKEVDEGMGDVAKRVGGMAKRVGGAVLNRLGHGSDEDMRKDLQRKMGMPQTGKKPNFADRIAGAKKEVDEMLGDVAAEAIKGALSPKQKKIDMNKNGKLDANDFAMLRKGGNKQVADEGAGQFYVYHKTKGDRAGGADYDLLKTFPDKDSATSFAQKYNNKISADKKNFHSAVVRTKSVKKDMDEGWDEMEKDVKSRMGARRVGDVTHGDKHDTQEVPGGRRVTRRVDPNTGYSVGADSDEPAAGEKRGRGRPKGPEKAPERVTGKATKHKGGRKTNENVLDITDRGEYVQEGDMAKDSIKTVVRHAQALEKILGDNDNLPEWVQSKLAKIEGMMTAVDDYMQNQEDDEMAMGEEKTSTRDNRAERAGRKVAKDIEYDEKKKDGIHGKKRGSEDDRAEKAGKKVAKDIEHDEKKKKVKEQGGTDTPTASSGFGFGQGIYDSMNRELESMISESMNISMSMNTDANGGPSRSVTVTATDDDAVKLGELLKNAGLGGGHSMGDTGATEVEIHGAEDVADQIRQAEHNHDGAAFGGEEVCDTCGSSDCGCETVDEAAVSVSNNQPDYPTDQETAQDNFEYSGGLNGPKSTGQTTIPVIAGQDERMGADNLRRLREMAGLSATVVEEVEEIDESHCSKCDCDPCECDESVEESIARLREMSGIREAKKVKEDDMEEGNLFTGNLAKARADGKKEADLDGDGKMEKVDEGILASTANLWKQYKGQYGV
jgi:hypothetical protein